jgi:predicted alpha/beta-fold hydrolase
MIAWIVGIAVALVGLVLAGLLLFTAWTARQVEKRLPPRGRFIDIDGARIHYLDEGTGPTLLLIHGLAGQMHNFTHSLLGKLQQDFRVVILDRPGSGYSTRPSEAMAPIRAQARTISRFLSGAPAEAAAGCRAFAGRSDRAGAGIEPPRAGRRLGAAGAGDAPAGPRAAAV